MTYFIFKHRHNNVYDIWLDEGWENWSKVLLTKEKCHIIGGQRVPASLLKEIHRTILS